MASEPDVKGQQEDDDESMGDVELPEPDVASVAGQVRSESSPSDDAGSQSPDADWEGAEEKEEDTSLAPSPLEPEDATQSAQTVKTERTKAKDFGSGHPGAKTEAEASGAVTATPELGPGHPGASSGTKGGGSLPSVQGGPSPPPPAATGAAAKAMPLPHVKPRGSVAVAFTASGISLLPGTFRRYIIAPDDTWLWGRPRKIDEGASQLHIDAHSRKELCYNPIEAYAMGRNLMTLHWS